MRIVSWNIRAGGGKRAEGILAQLLDWEPDIIGLCEFRGTPASQWLAEQLAGSGFQHQIDSTNSRHPAKNALLLASRYPLEAFDLRGMPRIRERWILARINSPHPVSIGMMHIPNYTEPKRKYPYMNAVLRLARAWQQGPAIFMGDTNCGKRGIDEENPLANVFKREHDWMEGMEKREWIDAFRHIAGDRREFTWYSHRNNGFRLDQAFINPPLAPSILDARHAWGRDSTNPDRRDALSDHAALILDLTAAPG